MLKKKTTQTPQRYEMNDRNKQSVQTKKSEDKQAPTQNNYDEIEEVRLAPITMTKHCTKLD